MFRLLLALALCTVWVQPVIAWSDDLDLYVLNNGSGPIGGFYVSPSDDDFWGDNVLVENVVPGELRTIPVDADLESCLYDVRIEFVNGPSGELRGLDVCATDTITVDDEFIVAS